MRSVLALRVGIRVNPAETEWKRPLRHIAQFLMRNMGLFFVGQSNELFALSFPGIEPFGSLLAGILSQKVGLPFTLFAGTILTLAGWILFLLYLPIVS